MNKSFLMIAMCLIAIFAQTQVPRDKVLVEIGTGTWCQYCPGAANGADDLIDNGKQVAVVEYHNGDSYTNTYSNARNSYYSITGFPTSKFDGVLTYVGGGSASQSNYNNYLPLYNQRIAINSSFIIQLNGSSIGNDYSVIATVTKVATYSGPNPVLHFVLTQSNIAQSWQGMTELNFVERLMVPNQNGTIINFSSGDVQVANLSFTKDVSWPLADCEIVVFLQNNTTKEILQGYKSSLDDLTIPLTTDAGLVNVYNIPVTSCSGKASPYLKIKNNTSNNLAAASIKYMINEGPLLSFNWSGSLGLNQEALFQLPLMTFSPFAENLFTAYIQTTNGVTDLNHINDTVHQQFNMANNYFSTIHLELKTDNNPQQTTWQVLNAANQIVFSGGPYSQPNTIIQQVMNFEQSGCYRLVINDSGNNGICCSSGNGYITLKDITNNPFYSGGNFGPSETIEFGVTITVFNLLAFLEGPFNPWSFDMNASLNLGGLLPLNQPYNTEPWNYGGSESVTSIPSSDIVDWVLVELRETTGGPETATALTMVGRQAAFINRYGQIVSLDGQSNLRFHVNITGNLYIVIHHRNHLSIMNASAIPNFGGAIYFDFSASPDYIYGGTSGCTDIYGSSAMTAGNANGDGIINSIDLSESWEINAGKKGYQKGDMNMNQQVDNVDKNGFWKINYLKQSQVPQ